MTIKYAKFQTNIEMNALLINKIIHRIKLTLLFSLLSSSFAF